MLRSKILFTIFLFVALPSTAQHIDLEAADRKVRILFLLDGSGSMLNKWDSETKISTAKKLLSNLIDSLKSNQNLELALRVYGHQFDKRFNNCTDTKLEVGFRKDNHDQMKARLRVIKPQGTTPIAYSLEQAAGDFPDERNVRNIVIIITDGIESCKGDPCEVSLALQKKKIFLKPFIIGIGGEYDFTLAYQCMGQYFDAQNVPTFKKALEKVIKQVLYRTTVTVNLLDINNQPTETNVNMTFVNNVTGETVYDYVHTMDKQKLPDTIDVDAVLSYDLIVNTYPSVVKKNIFFEGGEHNVISVKTPQGSLSFNQPYFNDYPVIPQAIIREKGKKETINVQKVNVSEKYLVGDYEIELLTLPRTYYSSVSINQGENTVLKVASPGMLDIVDDLNGYGSLYKIDASGKQEWFYNFENNKTKYSIALQPGDYKLVFRAENAYASRFTDIQKFTIKSNTTTTIKLFNK